MMEREVTTRFAVPEFFEVPDLTSAGPVSTVDDPQWGQRSAVYYDTHDLRLAREGIAMCRRQGGDDEGWHLTLPALMPARGAGAEVYLPLSVEAGTY